MFRYVQSLHHYPPILMSQQQWKEEMDNLWQYSHMIYLMQNMDPFTIEHKAFLYESLCQVYFH
jgi:hypothetical protein